MFPHILSTHTFAHKQDPNNLHLSIYAHALRNKHAHLCTHPQGEMSTHSHTVPRHMLCSDTHLCHIGRMNMDSSIALPPSRPQSNPILPPDPPSNRCLPIRCIHSLPRPRKMGHQHSPIHIRGRTLRTASRHVTFMHILSPRIHVHANKT